MIIMFVLFFAVIVIVSVAASFMIPGEATATGNKCYISTRFCPYCGEETSTDLNDCEHCHHQLVCEIPGHHHIQNHARDLLSHANDIQNHAQAIHSHTKVA